MYGATWSGADSGVIYELTPSGSGWTETVLYTPGNGAPYPWSGVVFDQFGNLYGVLYWGGSYTLGAVYQLSPSGSGWAEQTLHDFTGASDGWGPSGVITDAAGNLYGATLSFDNGPGTVFELTPASGGGSSFSTIYNFPAGGAAGPWTNLVMDSAGNLYGTTYGDGANNVGSVFKLTPSNGGWTYTSLHDFTGSDGAWPESNVSFRRQR